MIRKAFVMQVNPDAHEEYARRHNPIWPELETVLKAHGAHHYAIYLDKARNLLFVRRWRLNRKSAGTRWQTPMSASAGGNIWVTLCRRTRITAR